MHLIDKIKHICPLKYIISLKVTAQKTKYVVK